MKPLVICVMGPTASGKSALALDLALYFGSEIINGDSMQVYKGIPIGTAAPTKEMLRQVPHHLFAYLAVDETPNAATWAADAAAIIDKLASTGILPILAGGTFFWMKALFEGFSQIPPISVEFKAKALEIIRTKGLDGAYQLLKEVDPDIASRINALDTQRIARALEVFLGTGSPLSKFQQAPPVPATLAKPLRLILEVPREVLYQRIEQRLDEMFAQGLVAEVQSVLDQGYSPKVRPMKSSSYAPVVDFLEKRCDWQTMRDRIAQGHRNYAKRQITWLKQEDGIRLDFQDKEQAFKVVAEFLKSAD